MQLTLIGLGLVKGDLTARAQEALQSADVVFLRTQHHATADVVKAMGLSVHTMDALYEESEDYEELVQAICKRVLSPKEGSVVYAVPGSGCMGERAVRALWDRCHAQGIACELIPGVGLEQRAASWVGGVEAWTGAPIFEALDGPIDPRQALVITEMDKRELAGDMKLRLMQHYPDAHTVYMDAVPIPLYELDRQDSYTVDTAVLVPPLPLEGLQRYDFGHLVQIQSKLQDPLDGCPWAKAQTHRSLKHYMLEEAYEALDAIDANDPERLADELGDVLLQVVLHAQVAKNHEEFSIGDVTTAICRKMISRNPHIFAGKKKSITSEQVLERWEEIKSEEKAMSSVGDALMDIPRALPAALRAHKVQKRLADRGIVSPEEASMDEMAQRAMQLSDEAQEEREKVVGELLYQAVAVARKLGIPAELALDQETNRRIKSQP